MTFKPYTLKLRNTIKVVDRPLVMGIINATPDSFHAASRRTDIDGVKQLAAEMIEQGADIIDVGAMSSRPGSHAVDAREEIERLTMALQAVREVSEDIVVSVDTYRAEIARVAATHFGADIINDISGGMADEDMAATVARLGTPYILMHMRSNPAEMMQHTHYPHGVTYGVIKEMSEKISRLQLIGVGDIIVDPGFGFAKTMEQNYRLAVELPAIVEILRKPILAGVSRKSMFTRLLGVAPADSLEATTALNTLLLDRGASILRVHDVRAAVQAVTIFNQTIR